MCHRMERYEKILQAQKKSNLWYNVKLPDSSFLPSQFTEEFWRMLNRIKDVYGFKTIDDVLHFALWVEFNKKEKR